MSRGLERMDGLEKSRREEGKREIGKRRDQGKGREKCERS